MRRNLLSKRYRDNPANTAALMETVPSKISTEIAGGIFNELWLATCLPQPETMVASV